jgi:hypothetical protein
LGLQLGDRKRPERASSVVDDKPPIEVVRGHDLVSIYVTSARWWDVALSRQDLSPSRQTARTPQSPKVNRVTRICDDDTDTALWRDLVDQLVKGGEAAPAAAVESGPIKKPFR